MGLPVMVHVPDRDVPVAAIEAAFGWLRYVDGVFSTYREDSDIARINRGELDERDAAPEVRDVLSACRSLRERTAGAFDAEAAARMPSARERSGCGGGRPGAVEPAGYVKGWALDRAWEMLAAAGALNGVIDGGGDLVVRGRPAPDSAWRVGIQHPLLEDRLAAVLEPGDRCIATSGAYRRGRHIVAPWTGRAPVGVLSVTCIARDLATADAFATTGFAMGRRGAAWLSRQPEVEAMVIDDRRQVRMTPGFDALRVAPHRDGHRKSQRSHRKAVEDVPIVP